MELSEEDIEIIDLYVKDQLGDESKNHFESRMTEDHDFGNSVYEYINVIKAIRFREATLLKEKLTTLESTQSKKKSHQVWYAAAAISLLLAVFIIFQNLNTTDTSIDDLYAQHFQHYPNIEQTITRSDGAVAEPYRLYDLAAYQAALPLFSEETPAGKFYKAQCFMALEQFDQSTKLLSTLASTESKYTVPSKWYLALSLLKSNDIEKSKAYLEQLEEEADYQRKAKDLLQDLSKLD